MKIYSQNTKKSFLGVALLLICALFFPPLYAQNEFRTGCILNTELYEMAPLPPPLMRGDYEAMPSGVSMRKFAPTPQNQGAYGTCVGWSTAYAALTIMMAQHQNWTNQVLITENAFSPFFIYEQAKSINDIYCQEGTSLYNALEIIKDIGAVKIHDFASQCGQAITNTHQQKAGKYRIKEYRRLFDAQAPNKVDIVKKSLSQNRPVVIGMQCCTESFLNAKGQKFWSLQEGDNPSPQGGHALTVIGYDDEKFGGAFELMNSWGTTWGDEGFIWFSYEDFERYCFEAYEMILERKEERKLGGTVRFALSAEEEMPTLYKGNGVYETLTSYRSGTLFRIYISNDSPAYVYAFNFDQTNKTFKIFPHADNVSAYLPYRGNNIALPDEDHFIQMDNQIGKDYFCILYSDQKLNIGEILRRMELQEGSFEDRLQAVLGESLLPSYTANYSISNEISFNVPNLPEKKIVPLIVTIDHTR